MLAITLISHLLAVLVAVGSLSFYLAAFFYPEVNRPRDIIWSGLGLVYAALLWFCAAQVTATILLAQLIVVVLLGVLGWQTLSIRRQKTPVYQQTPVVITPEIAGNWTKNKLNQLRIAPAEPVPLKLRKRSLNEFPEERLGVPIDPRRRPAYDYEFVEDGLWDDEAALNEATLNSDEGPLLAEPLPAEVAPPSAIADVISVEEPEVNAPEVETIEPNPEVNDSEVEAIEPVLPVEPPPAEQSSAEPPPAEKSSEEQSPAEPEADAPSEETPSKVSAPNPQDSDWDDSDWDDSDWIAEPTAPKSAKDQSSAPFTSSQNSSPQRPSPQKPSPLAMPLILAGWVKDVVTSLTKPKPPKPVIEIPRREPAPEGPIESTDREPETPTETSNWDD